MSNGSLASRIFPYSSTEDVRNRFSFGPYLGRSRIGHVRLVEEEDTKSLRICKTILKDKIKNEENDLAELYAEVYGLQSVSGHPNVVELLQHYEDSTAVHIITSFCPGGDLYDFITDRERLTERETAAVCIQVASALSHCHGLNIVHRDIKPENILIVGRTDGPDRSKLPLIKLNDFGMSAHISPGEVASGMAGSLWYMAPEMLWGSGCIYGFEVDIWSLGVVLLIALTGELPFPGSNEEEVLASISEAEEFGPLWEKQEEPWTGVSREAKHLLSRMLSVDPKCRPTAEEILKDPWIVKFTSPKILECLNNRSLANNLSNDESARCSFCGHSSNPSTGNDSPHKSASNASPKPLRRRKSLSYFPSILGGGKDKVKGHSNQSSGYTTPTNERLPDVPITEAELRPSCQTHRVSPVSPTSMGTAKGGILGKADVATENNNVQESGELKEKNGGMKKVFGSLTSKIRTRLGSITEADFERMSKTSAV